ncbi:MAG TPA: SMP-30/gluconolactonase/LRE family protein [Thermomicrobiales bacterium]|nr:SMP-30/gluconolactonase/LRE family protein [Thermomicrobiales bacterium]
MQPVVPFERGSVFFDATLGSIRLKHPEGIAIAADGAIWCGGDGGEIYRIAPDASGIELIASTNGFTLGMAFDAQGLLYTCDLGHRAVFRLNPKTGTLHTFATGSSDASIRVPNYPVVDTTRNCLYVSDSYSAGTPGPGIWRFDLDSGKGALWYDRPLNFANGMALSPDRQTLYVIETFARRVSRISIADDGAAGDAEPFVEGIERLPDGLAFDADGNLYISCYEPSRLFRATPDGRLELLFDDPEAHLLCHPTNCAFRGTDLFTSNLGRWHITRIELGISGAPLL